VGTEVVHRRYAQLVEDPIQTRVAGAADHLATLVARAGKHVYADQRHRPPAGFGGAEYHRQVVMLGPRHILLSGGRSPKKVAPS
jgi:hypothetical protein